MNEDWRGWTKLNLERGCAPEEVNNILTDNGFSPYDIQAAMGDKYPGVKKKFSQNLSSRLNKNKKKGKFNHPQNLRAADYKKLTKVKALSHSKAIVLDDDRIQLLSIPDFLSESECAILTEHIDSKLRPSTITAGADHSLFRTSSTCDLGLLEHPLIKDVDLKIAKTLGMQLGWSETIQGQKYDVSQEFKAHTDYFEPNSKEFETYAAKMGQRTWTFMVYLNSTPKGGETHFTEIDEVFTPQRGTAVIWNNLFADGKPNRATMHHGCPVHEGEKYIITKWFRDKGQGPMLFK